NTIAVDIGGKRGVHLRDRHVAGVLRRIVVDDHVTFERDPAIPVSCLREPGQAESVCVQPSDDIVETVAVDVIYAELGATGALRSAPATKRLGMIDPRALIGSGQRL